MAWRRPFEPILVVPPWKKMRSGGGCEVERKSAMETRLSAALGLSSYGADHSLSVPAFTSIFTHFNSLLASPDLNLVAAAAAASKRLNNGDKFITRLSFGSVSLSSEAQILESQSSDWIKPSSRNSPKVLSLSVSERAFIGAVGGGIAGAFTHFCLHPVDTIKTKLQTKGAAEIYKNTFDAIAKTFKSKGIVGFYSGISAVIVGSTASSAVYFGTCEFGQSILSQFDNYPSFLIPPTAGAMGNIFSSAIMVPKELITQRMQAGAKGKSWEVLLKILEKDGVLGLYAGYSATLLRNLPAGVLNYSSFEYLKAAVLSRTKQNQLNPFQSVCCGAMAGAIAASLTTPLDVVKTRLMTQGQGEAMAMYSGVWATLRRILKEEGLAGFSHGMGPRVLHGSCFSALGFLAFETAKVTVLHHYCKRKELTLA